MSLLAISKANGHDPHAWLSDMLTRLPTTRDRDILNRPGYRGGRLV